MRLVCQNCGNEESAYFVQSNHTWYVWVREDTNGNFSLAAEPSDCEETRYFMNKLGAAGRMKESMEAGQTLRTRKTFDCTDCGEEDCVRIIET